MAVHPEIVAATASAHSKRGVIGALEANAAETGVSAPITV